MKSKFGLAFVWIIAMSMSLTAIPTVVCNIRGAIVARLDLPADHPKTFIVPSSHPLPDQRLATLPHGKYYLADQAANNLESISSLNPFHYYDATALLMPQEEQDTGDIVVADFNADGLEDYFVFNGRYLVDSLAQSRIFIRQAAGGFADETAERMPVFQKGGLEAHLIDFQHDGSNDLLLIPYTNGEPNCYLLLNNGEGIFGLAAAPLIPSIAALNAQVVDFNHDGYDDVIFMAIEQDVNRFIPQIWINNAGATFVNESASRLPLAELTEYGMWSVDALDLTGDGAKDLILINDEISPGMNAEDLVLVNDGYGHFNILEQYTLAPLYEEVLEYRSLDYDLDGDNDLVATTIAGGFSRSVYLLKNNNGTFVDYSEDMYLVRDHTNQILIRDYNEDGYPDMFLGCVILGEPSYDQFFVNIEGEFWWINNTIPIVLDFTVDMSFIDYNGDPYPDVLIGNSGRQINTTGLNRLYIYSYGLEGDDPQAPVTKITNYPNPFNPSTAISYTLPQAEESSLIIYNLKGQVVRHLASGLESAGNHLVTWDGRDDQGRYVGSGIYNCRLVSGNQAKTHKMLLIK